MQNGSLDAGASPSVFLRAAAFLIDWAVVLLLATFIASGASADQAGRLLILLVTLSLYHIASLIAMSATPGKMAMRIHVSDAAGGRMTPDRAILRYLVFLVGVLVPVGVVVSLVMVLLDPQRRALHDRLAGTRVRYGRPPWAQDDRRF